MSQLFANLLAQNQTEIVKELAKGVKERAGPTYAAVPLERLESRMEAVFDAVHQAAAEDDPAILNAFAAQSVEQRATERYSLEEIGNLIQILRQILFRVVNANYEDPEQRLEIIYEMEDLAHSAQQEAVKVYLQEYEERMEAQRRALAELSTPVVQVYEDILVLPLVGAIDTERARRVMEELLEGIMRHQAELVIIDITGVPVVDTAVANHLMQTIKSARLLGAQSILVGISSEIAQTLIHLQVDLTAVVTRSNLQTGIEYALEQMGLGIGPQVEPPPEEEEASENPPEPRLPRQ